MVCSLRTKCNVDDFTLVPELPRFGGGESNTSDEERLDNFEKYLLELFALPGGSPASQRHMREEEMGLVALSCHFVLDALFLSMNWCPLKLWLTCRIMR